MLSNRSGDAFLWQAKFVGQQPVLQLDGVPYTCNQTVNFVGQYESGITHRVEPGATHHVILPV